MARVLALPEGRSTIIERKARALAEEFYRIAVCQLEDGDPAEEYFRCLVELAGACALSAPYDFTVRALAEALRHERHMEEHFGRMFGAEAAG